MSLIYAGLPVPPTDFSISIHNFIVLDTSARTPESSLSPAFLIHAFWSVGRFDFTLWNPQVFRHLTSFPVQHCFRPSFCLCETFWLVGLFKPAFIMLMNCLPWGTWIAFCLFSSSSACWSPSGQLYCSLRNSVLATSSIPMHPSTIYMIRLLTSFRLLCKCHLTFALKHFTYTSYPRSLLYFWPFALLTIQRIIYLVIVSS